MLQDVQARDKGGRETLQRLEGLILGQENIAEIVITAVLDKTRPSRLARTMLVVSCKGGVTLYRTLGTTSANDHHVQKHLAQSAIAVPIRCKFHIVSLEHVFAMLRRWTLGCTAS